MNTLAIDIPIAVYAYDRHKEPTDPKAVKRIGFYDKRTVLAETKFQRYYVKAKAIASRMAFKDDPVARDDEGKLLKNPDVRNTKIKFQYDKMFRDNKKKELQDDKEDYTVYIPIKYYKANYTQITGAINGLLSMKNRTDKGRKWFLYHGQIPKNIIMEYAALTKEEQCAYNNRRYVQFSKQVLEKLKIKMPTCIERDGDPAISPTEEVGASMTAIVDNVPKDAWFSCGGEFTGKERLYVLLSHVFGVVCISTFSTYAEYAERGILAWNLVRTDLIKNMYLTMATFFQTNEDTGMIGMSAVLLASLYKITENDIELKKYILETLSGVLKTTGTALQGKTTPEAILSELLPSPSSTINPNATAVNTISSLVASSRNLMAQIRKLIPYIVDLVKPKFQLLLTMFQNFTATGSFTAANATATAANATATAVNATATAANATATAANATATGFWATSYTYTQLALKTVVPEPLKPLFRIANVGYFVYKLYQDGGAWSDYNQLICLFAKLMRFLVKGGIDFFINQNRRHRLEYMLLEGNEQWVPARRRLLELNANIEIEQQPRMILEGKTTNDTAITCKAIYSENPNMINTVSKMLPSDKDWIPYVYVVATGLADINGTVRKVWYFYDYNYYYRTPTEVKEDVRFDFTIWQVQQTIQVDNKEKQILSRNIQTQVGGEYCTTLMNGRLVEGVPFAFYLGGYFAAYRFILPALLASPKIYEFGINLTNLFYQIGNLLSKNNPTWQSVFFRYFKSILEYYAIFRIGKPLAVLVLNNFQLEDFLTNKILQTIDFSNIKSQPKSKNNTVSQYIKSGLDIPLEVVEKLQKIFDFLPCLIASWVYATFVEKITL